MPVLDDVAAYIASQGLGTVKTGSAQPSVPWLIYKGVTPPGDRDDAISLTLYSGGAPLQVMGTTSDAVVAEQPRLQVLARGMSYSTTMAKAETLWTALHNKSGTLGSTRYLLIECQQSPFPIGRDDATRFMMGFNCIVWKERG